MAGKTKRFAAKPPTQRQLRVGETIRHALSEILSRDSFFDPDLEGVSVTVSEISVSPDLSNARVYTMPLGGQNSENVLPALNRLAPVLQRGGGAGPSPPCATAEIHPRRDLRDRGTVERRVQQHPHRRLTAAAWHRARAIPFMAG